MDNITHSLVGLTAGELLYQAASRKAPSRPLRFALWIISLVTNNLPDLDFLYTGITGGKLGYLLHHRGHTHTFAAGLLESAIVVGIFAIVSKLRAKTWTRHEWMWIGVAALLGPISHILMDSVNIYGVHPFWPLDNTWWYGDFLFIVEPWLWVVLGSAIAFSGISKVGKICFLIIPMAAVILSYISKMVPMPFVVSLGISSAILFVGYAKLPSEWSTRVGASVVIALLGAFFLSSRYVKSEIRALSLDPSGARKIVDVAISPTPANLFCWRAYLVENTGTEAVYSIGSFSPIGTPAKWCPSVPVAGTTFSMDEVKVQGNDARLVWEKRGSISLEKLRDAHASSCEFRSFLAFARIPYIESMGNALIMGDLRFDRSVNVDFAEIKEVAREVAADTCPLYVPDWVPPRADLF